MSHATEQKTIYTLTDERGCEFEGYDIDGLKLAAAEYHESRLIDAGQCGDLTLCGTVTWGDDNQHSKEITFKVCVEYDGYDHGRFDYRAGIGAI